MEYVIDVLVNVLLYLSIPILIRYVILRKPLQKKWITIVILIPIFIGFSFLINIQRHCCPVNYVIISATYIITCPSPCNFA